MEAPASPSQPQPAPASPSAFYAVLAVCKAVQYLTPFFSCVVCLYSANGFP